LALVVESFQRLPAGQTLSAGGFGSLAEIGATVFGTALGLALPLIAALLIANLFVAVLARAAPQLNLFAVGFPLTLGLGLLALVFWLPSLLSLDFAGLATTLARQVTTAFGR
jgi:flagellar biosynthetic protein FliR